MTMVVAMWCRHINDNIIGVDGHLPWKIESDVQHFLDVFKEKNVVCGRKTYENFPNRTIEGCRFFVISHNRDYELSDTKHHCLIANQKDLENLIEEDDNLYVAGGAEIYKMFMEGKEKFKPHIIVDCVYEGELLEKTGQIAEITSVIETMKKKYRQITPDYCLDGVASRIWIRKGEFVSQETLKNIVTILEKNAALR